MIRTAVSLLIIAAIAGGGYYMGFSQRTVEVVHDPVRHEPSAPRIEQVRALASLVTLDVPIADLHVSELDGLTGGLRMVVNVRGDVQIMTDLNRARFEEMDAERQDVVLVLPRPEPQRPRVDHERTRIVEVQRTGMWRIAPGDGGERALTNRAMTAAQRVLGEAAEDEQLVTQACSQAEQVMQQFFGALGWNVVIRWDEGGQPHDPQQAVAAR